MKGYALELRILHPDDITYCVVELQAESSARAVARAKEHVAREFGECGIELHARPCRYDGAPRRPRTIRPMRNVI